MSEESKEASAAASDTSSPATRETASDTASETASDTASETARDATSETASDATHETARDATSETASPASTPDAEARDAAATDDLGETADAVFEALWKRVLEAWDDDKPHQAALSYAIEKERLPEIAGRYRKLFDDADKGARAKKKVDGIVVAATQMLFATKTPAREKLPWQWTASVAAVMVLVVAFLAYKLFANR